MFSRRRLLSALLRFRLLLVLFLRLGLPRLQLEPLRCLIVIRIMEVRQRRRMVLKSRLKRVVSSRK
jgi:hypothetical protein